MHFIAHGSLVCWGRERVRGWGAERQKERVRVSVGSRANNGDGGGGGGGGVSSWILTSRQQVKFGSQFGTQQYK